MAESNKKPMSMDSFRANQAASKASSPTDGDTKPAQESSSAKRPATAGGSRRSASVENVSNSNLGASKEKSSSAVSLAVRQERVRVLREKQVEERKKKNEERRLAFEERKRKKIEEDKQKWEDLKAKVFASQTAASQGAANLRPGTGRKLPNVPSSSPQKRPVSASPASNTQTRPSSLPKQQRPASATSKKSPSGNNLRSPPQSTSSTSPSVSSESSPRHSPASTPTSSRSRSSLGKASSTSHLPSTERRGSAGTLRPQSSSSKSRPRSMHGLNPQSQAMGGRSSSHDYLSVSSNRPLSKSHSTSALNQIHTSDRITRKSYSGQKPGTREGHKPSSHGQKQKNKPEPKPHAGLTDEKAAKEALAERRRKAREEAERQAALDKERAEQERIRKEEEERIRKEEEEKEEARQRELAELLRQQEEERFQRAKEEAEKRAKEEAEQVAAEQKRKEEEKKQREEEERKARQLAEQKLKEDEERRKLEEIERNERRKRVEMIMTRTRQTASPTQITQKETKELDLEGTKRKVDELLQKGKDMSTNQFQPSKTLTTGAAAAQEGDQKTLEHQETVAQQIEDVLSSITQTFGNSQEKLTESSVNGEAENVGESLNIDSPEVSRSDKPSADNVEHLLESGTCTIPKIPSIQVDEPIDEPEKHEHGVENTKQRTSVLQEYSVKMNENSDSENLTHITNGNGTNGGSSENNMLNQLDNEANGFFVEKFGSKKVTQDLEDEDLWSRTESVMKAQESKVVETLENAGIVAEGDETFSNGNEEKLWRIVEGKADILGNAV